jgi:hypothetical protein
MSDKRGRGSSGRGIRGRSAGRRMPIRATKRAKPAEPVDTVATGPSTEALISDPQTSPFRLYLLSFDSASMLPHPLMVGIICHIIAGGR